MKFGVAIGPYTESIEEIPDEFEFAEIAIGEMEVDPDELDLEKIREDLESNDLDLIVHLPFRQPLVTGVEEIDKSNLEYLKRLLSVSKEIGAEKAVVHVNNRYGLDQEELHEKDLIKVMNRLDEIGRKKQIQIVFENIPEVNQSPAVELERLGEIAMENDLKICFDTAHAYAAVGQEEMEEFLDKFSETISHLHLQDSIRGEDSHVAINHGEIDWEAITERIQDFDGTATFEVYSQDFEYHLISKRKFLEFCGQNI